MHSLFLSPAEVVIRLSLAAFFGGLVGLERERKDWAAGLRTHMMVCVGAALTMIVSAYGFSDVLEMDHITLDPSRIAAQVISGIGFIGAGTILFLKQGIIRGLTTASGLWTVAGIGLATGGGLYFAAGFATILALIILWVLQPFEKIFSSRFNNKSLRIIISDPAYLSSITELIITKENAGIYSCDITKADNKLIITVKSRGLSKETAIILLNELQLKQGVEEVSWTK